MLLVGADTLRQGDPERLSGQVTSDQPERSEQACVGITTEGRARARPCGGNVNSVLKEQSGRNGRGGWGGDGM